MPEAPLVEVADATLRYDANGRDVVRGADLVIRAGEAVGVAGESGSGKTTLARAIVGDLAPAAGHVRIGGRPWSDIGRRDPLRRRVQMIFQDPYSALNPRMSPLAAVSETRRVVAGRSRRDARRDAEALLDRAGLAGKVTGRSPAGLSGGQRQRVVIARALACEPDLLVADEPTSSLDVSVQAQILNLLLELRRERGLALLLVTHDLAVLKHMTDTAMVMLDGDIVERGPTERLLRAPEHAFTKSLVAALELRIPHPTHEGAT